MTLVIPLAGRGQRFRDVGYITPKPFIKIDGQPMIKHVVDNLRMDRVILICLPEHQELTQMLFPNDIVIPLLEPTKGAICTVLHARGYIDNADPVVIASCDQILDWDKNLFYQFVKDLDGCLVTYKSTVPNHSFCKVDKTGKVIKVAEKDPISNNANVGVYYFGSGRDLITAAEKMIANDDSYCNEYYTAPVYNYLEKTNVRLFELKKEQVHLIGTPVDLRRYING